MKLSPPTGLRLRRGLALGSAVAVVAALGITPTLVADASPKKSTRTDEPGVTANLFEWNWASVGKACTDTLGPAGYGGVQVAPPQDSMKRTELGNGSNLYLHPWWEVYQPVRYALTSRMGNERQFRTMVDTCRRAGVKVYVDAVINHTTGQGSVSYGGKSFTPYNYPDAGYTRNNFHYPKGECPSSDGGIQDFNNKAQVFKCNLVGLEDLDTDTGYVQRKLAAYLNKLLSYGVSGFRVDAAKHIGQDDLDAIYARLDRTVDGTKPYWALEVFGGAPGSLSPEAFTRSGDVLGLDGVKQLQAAFKSYANQGGSISTLETFGSGSGLTASKETLSFVQNHDTERNPGESLSYKDGATNTLATNYLLASGYGSPQVYSGFTFPSDDPATPNDNETAASPPSNAQGYITDTDCSSTAWNCLINDKSVIAMVGFHNHVGSAPQRNWWDDGGNVIAFSRGSKGWVALNNNGSAKRIRVQTGLKRGNYTDEISGNTVTVSYQGYATVTVPAKGAVALRSDSRD